MSDVAAIVLAAGRGTRFGREPKLLAPLGEHPLVRHVVRAAVGSLAAPVVVVTGHRAPEIVAAIEGDPVEVVHNAAFADGLSTSLKAGFAALPPDAQAAVVLLGDMPLVESGLIDSLVRAWRQAGEPAALVPTVEGRRGNPVVISRRLEDVIAGLSGDIGLGPSLRGRPDVVEWPTADRAVLADVDTSDEILRLQARTGRGDDAADR